MLEDLFLFFFTIQIYSVLLESSIFIAAPQFISPYFTGMEQNDHSWLKPKTENEESKAENWNNEVNYDTLKT